MSDPHAISKALTSAERLTLMRTGIEFAKYPKAQGLSAVNCLRNRHQCIEAEDAVRGIWNYRLTDLGRRVKSILAETEGE